MPYVVILLPAAADDLEQLFDYIAENDAPGKAIRVITRLQELIDGLAEFPDRGRRVRELEELGYRACREVSFKPYRIIYRVVEDAVRIYMVVEGRRNMQKLLEQRLLGP